MVASVYRHVEHHALIKDNSQMSKMCTVILTVKILHGTEREIYTTVAAFLDGFNRYRKGTHIEQLF